MSFNFMATVTIGSDFGAPKIKSVIVSIVSPFQEAIAFLGSVLVEKARTSVSSETLR